VAPRGFSGKDRDPFYHDEELLNKSLDVEHEKTNTLNLRELLEKLYTK